MLNAIGPEAFYAIVIVFGGVVGSFLNVVVYRLPRGESIVFPASHCPACGRAIKPWDNLPVLSYLILRGRCRICRGRISLRYPLVELCNGLLYAAVAWRFGASVWTLLLWVFISALLVAALVDLDHQIIPDSISLGGTAFGLIFVPLAYSHATDASYSSALWSSGLGALLGGGMLWLVAFLHARLSVAMGRKFPHWPGEGEELPGPGDADYWLWFPGLGLGDVKLLAMVGAFLGPAGVLDTIVVASVLGLVLGGVVGLLQRDLASPFGFGPAIAAGAVFSAFVPIHPLILQTATSLA